MKNLLFIVMLISLNSYAQTKTGTGGTHETDVSIEGSPIQGGGNGPIHKFITFTESLEKQETNCRSSGHKYLSLKDKVHDPMQVYLKLSVLKSTFEADDKCKDVSAYFKCLYTPEAKGNLEKFLAEKDVKNELVKRYKISNKEAKHILKFFKTLDKGCDKGDCEM